MILFIYPSTRLGIGGWVGGGESTERRETTDANTLTTR